MLIHTVNHGPHGTSSGHRRDAGYHLCADSRDHFQTTALQCCSNVREQNASFYDNLGNYGQTFIIFCTVKFRKDLRRDLTVKNYKNRPTFTEVIVKIKVGHYFETRGALSTLRRQYIRDIQSLLFQLSF